jgi:small-conductance mechanosensitive channel
MFQQIPQVIERVIPLAIFIVCNTMGIVISKVAFSRLSIILEKIAGNYHEAIVKALKGMPVIWGMIIGSYGAIHAIDFAGYWLHILDGLFIIMGIFSATVITARMFSSIAKDYIWQGEGVFPSASILVNLVVVSIYIVGALILLQTFGISIAPILTALGVGGLAVALALQDTLSNLFSGLHILLSKQIKVGDYIKLSTGEEGNVADISWRNTTIQVMSNNMVIVPNQKIASSIITNYYMPDRELSIVVGASVSYDSDLAQVERITVEVAKEVMKEIEAGIEGFEPAVRFHTFGDSSINFNVVLRVKEYADQYVLKHEFIKRLHLRYHQEGIGIPFPVRKIYTEQL